MSNWYKDNVEPGVRDLVQLLRDNGVNTECSCVALTIMHKSRGRKGVNDEIYLPENTR